MPASRFDNGGAKVMGQSETVKSGFVALVGPPNVGKSTLLNTLLGQKISIVSAKPQTTRNRILGILNGPDHQVIFLDTPGLHRPHRPLNAEMVRIALETLAEVEVILFMVDATLPLPEKGKPPTRYLENISKPAILLLNKIDLLPKEKILPLLAAYEKMYPFTAIIPISALTRDGVDRLLTEVLTCLPQGPRLYPEDIPTDATERFIVAEIIREKVFLLTGQEVPYSTAVAVDSFKEDPARRLVTIHATIFLEKSSQKGIVIGKQGAKLKAIGQQARQEIEELLAQRVNLRLWVKVKKNWTKDARFLRELGF
jgi:GTP-binding protein Era